jgi:hypothetical protein
MHGQPQPSQEFRSPFSRLFIQLLLPTELTVLVLPCPYSIRIQAVTSHVPWPRRSDPPTNCPITFEHAGFVAFVRRTKPSTLMGRVIPYRRRRPVLATENPGSSRPSTSNHVLIPFKRHRLHRMRREHMATRPRSREMCHRPCWTWPIGLGRTPVLDP